MTNISHRLRLFFIQLCFHVHMFTISRVYWSVLLPKKTAKKALEEGERLSNTIDTAENSIIPKQRQHQRPRSISRGLIAGAQRCPSVLVQPPITSRSSKNPFNFPQRKLKAFFFPSFRFLLLFLALFLFRSVFVAFSKPFQLQL